MIAFLPALLSFATSRTGMIIIAGTLALTALVVFIHHREQAAVERAVQKIERANDEANKNAATGGDTAGQAFDACVARHGTWDRAQLVCHGGTGQ